MKQLLKAVLIAAALVVLIKVFAFTSCTIPSTGMENSLLRGERVIVNKWSYGLRLPLMGMTGYHRLAARGVERGDIVLFNNPAGKGTIDRRELFINRCIGLPGDTLMLNGQLIQTRDQVLSPDSKLVYAYPGEQEDLIVEAMRRVGIGDNKLVGFDRGDFLRSFSHYEIYLMRQELRGQVTFRSLQTDTADGVHPFVVPRTGQGGEGLSVECQTALQHHRAARGTAGTPARRHALGRRTARDELHLHEGLPLGCLEQLGQPVRLAPFWLCPRRPHHRAGIAHLVLQGHGRALLARLPMETLLPSRTMTHSLTPATQR